MELPGIGDVFLICEIVDIYKCCYQDEASGRKSDTDFFYQIIFLL